MTLQHAYISSFTVPLEMLETACDRIEQFCRHHYPVINKRRIIPKLRHQDSMARMVMGKSIDIPDPPMSTSPPAFDEGDELTFAAMSSSSSSTDEDDEIKAGSPPGSENGSYITSNYAKPPMPGVPRIRRQTEMRLTSMSAK